MGSAPISSQHGVHERRTDLDVQESFLLLLQQAPRLFQQPRSVLEGALRAAIFMGLFAGLAVRFFRRQVLQHAAGADGIGHDAVEGRQQLQLIHGLQAVGRVFGVVNLEKPGRRDVVEVNHLLAGQSRHQGQEGVEDREIDE